MPSPLCIHFCFLLLIILQWSEGDVWRVSVPLPIDSPIAFKYIELGPNGGLVGWGQDLCAGSGNMSVLVERAQDFVTGFTVTLDPPMPTGEAAACCVTWCDEVQCGAVWCDAF